MRALCGTENPDNDKVINKVLNAMTSGDRLAYRYDAIVCKRIEARYGRSFLVKSILSPDIFHL
jgi:hypothetical protein